LADGELDKLHEWKQQVLEEKNELEVRKHATFKAPSPLPTPLEPPLTLTSFRNKNRACSSLRKYSPDMADELN
jgi:hypothetical protein